MLGAVPGGAAPPPGSQGGLQPSPGGMSQAEVREGAPRRRRLASGRQAGQGPRATLPGTGTGAAGVQAHRWARMDGL